MLRFHPNPKPWRQHSLLTPLLATATTHKLLTPYIPPIRASSDDNSRTQGSETGSLRRLVLTQQGRAKLNLKPDRDFYSYPRFVTHVDDGFISSLTELYSQRLRPGCEILDLMSSWVSHLPENMEFKRVVGHGLNAQELARNPQLDYFFVKDLNKEHKLELESTSFDAVLCTVSVQYLQQPEQVFAEVFRVLKPGGVFIVSFSNRMFFEKAVASWRDGSEYSRVQLVVQYFQSVVGFTEAEVVRKKTGRKGDDDREKKSLSPWFSWFKGLLDLLSGSSDPFYAVIAYKNFKPVYE
ncbi:hypothetical protein LINPERPRIM_LOCUS14857 [Linum perenne]